MSAAPFPCIMPDDLKDAPNGQQSPTQWVSTAAAAAALGVSEKTVWRRAKAGQLAARKVSGTRGGLVWEIALDSTGQPSGQTDKQDAQPTTRTDNQNTQPDKTERPTGHRDGQSEDFATRYVARLESENDFLRRALESAQQSEAITKAALREALKAMPKAITGGAAESAPSVPESRTNRGGERNHATHQNGPQIAPESDEISSYDALADWLESEMNL